MSRPELTPCLICEKAIVYLWNDPASVKESTTNLNGASDVTIFASYGSVFDCNEYHGVICDDCLDRLVQSKRLRFIKEHPFF